jgi:hypothetical protein
VGRGMGDSWPGEGCLGHVWATYMSPKLFLLLACLSTTNVYWPIHIKESLGSITNFHRNLALFLCHEAIPLVKEAELENMWNIHTALLWWTSSWNTACCFKPIRGCSFCYCSKTD